MAIIDAFSTAWGMLTLKDAKAKEAAQSPFVNVLVIFAVAALASAIGARIMPSMGIGSMGMSNNILIMLIIGFVWAIIGMFVWTSISYMFIKIFGGSVGYIGLYKALGHASLAGVLAIIPALGIIGLIWNIIASIIGIRSIAGLSTGKAVATVVLSIVVLLVFAVIIGVIVAMTFLSALVGMSAI